MSKIKLSSSQWEKIGEQVGWIGDWKIHKVKKSKINHKKINVKNTKTVIKPEKQKVNNAILSLDL